MTDSTEKLQRELQAAQRTIAELQDKLESRETTHRLTTLELEENRSALLFMLEDLEAGRKEIEQAHQEWVSALDVVDDPIFLHDKEFRILRCNKAYQRGAGISFNEIIGRLYYEIFPKTGAPLSCCLRALEKAEDEEEVTVGGAIYRSRAFAIKDEQGAYLYSVHTLEDITERKQAEDAFRALVGTSVTNVGAAFFHETVRSLSTWLGVECVIVGEIVDGNRVQALAMQLDGKAIKHYEYDLPGTPCDSAANKGYCEYPEGIRQLFPADKDLVDMGAEAYVGTPIRDKNGKAIGILCALSRHKLVSPPMLNDVFEIIAARAGAEIERKRAEDARIESEEKFRKITESAQDAIIMMGADRCISFWNAAAERIFGYTAEEAMGQDLHALIVPEPARARFTQAFPHFQESGEGPIIGKVTEVSALRKGGEEFPVELSISTTRLGGQWHAISTVRDITERKRIESDLGVHRTELEMQNEALRHVQIDLEESRDQFVDLYEFSPVGYLTLGREEMIDKINLTGATLLGVERNKLLHHRFAPFVAAEDRDRWHRHFLDVLQHDGQQRCELALRCGDGSVLHAQLDCLHMKVDGASSVRIALTDITQRKQAEESLKNMAAKYHTMFELSSDAIMLLDEKGFFDCNPATLRMFSCPTRGDFISKHPAEFSPPTQPGGEDSVSLANQRIAKAFKNGNNLFEWMHRRLDGADFPAEVLLTALKLDGKPVLQATVRDITERKQAEAAIRHANRALAAMSAVNHTLVHAASEDELLQSICQAIVKQRGYRLAWVGYKQHDESQSIKIMASAGHDEGYMDALRITWAETERGMGPSGRAARSGTTQLCQDIASDPLFLPWREAALQRGYASCIALPLLDGDNAVFGILTVYAAEANTFIAAEIALLEEMAGDMVFGVHTLHTRHERDLALVKNQEQLVQLQDSLEDTVRAIATIVEMRDPYTAGHQVRVADLATAIAKQMGLPEEQVHAIHLAGTVHDLGKIQIPAEILSKPGKISDIEFSFIKTHPQAGYDILKDINFPWPIAQMVLQHHERMDGSGYPQGLKGEQIIIEARILAVADVVEAISAHRPYRAGLGNDVAMEEITKNRGKFYDPQVVDACLALFREQGYRFK